MDGPAQLKPTRILGTILVLALLGRHAAADFPAQTADLARSRVALAQACVALAETARDVHHPAAAHRLAEAGMSLLQLEQGTDGNRDVPRARLEARLRVVRAQSLAVDGAAVGADVAARECARQDFIAALDLGRPLLDADPADRGLRRAMAAAELGLAQDETDPWNTIAHCERAASLLQWPDDGAAPVRLEGRAPSELWMLASAYQLLGETHAQRLSDPHAALEAFTHALPLWQRLQHLHPLGATKLARWHLAVAGTDVLLDQQEQAREHLEAALQLTSEVPRGVESLLVRARALTSLATLPADSAAHPEEPADQLAEAAALYRRLPPVARPPVEEAAVWRRQAEVHLHQGDTARAKELLERAVAQLESDAPKDDRGQSLERRNIELALGRLALGQLSASSQPDEARRRFSAACELFAAPMAERPALVWNRSAIDAQCMRLICETRLAEHLARTGEPEPGVRRLRQVIEPFLARIERNAPQQSGDHAPAVARAAVQAPAKLLLPLARALHWLANIQGGIDAQQAMRSYSVAIECYEAALQEDAGDPVDLAVCQLDRAALLAMRDEPAAARECLQQAVASLRAATDRDPHAWLPLASAYAQCAELDAAQDQAPNMGFLNQAIDAARQAVAGHQPAAGLQLATLLLQRGLASLRAQEDVSAARRDLEQAVLEFRRVRSEPADASSDEDHDLDWSELIAARTLAKLLWSSGAAPDEVCRRWREARQVLESLREESGPWYAEAARLESLRAELIVGMCAAGVPSTGLSLVPTIEALPAPAAPAATAAPADGPQPPAVVPSPAAAAQAYEIANRHYAAADRLGVDVVGEWDVLLFNAADYCENFLGDAHSALRYFEQELALQDRVAGPASLRDANRAWLGARMGLIESRLLARPDRAAELYREAAKHLETAIAAEAVAPQPDAAVQAELALGLLAAQLPELQQAAQEHFVAALEMLKQVDPPTESTLSFEYWAHHGLAQQLRRSGDEAGAREHLGRAAELAAQLGFGEAEVATGQRSGVE